MRSPTRLLRLLGLLPWVPRCALMADGRTLHPWYLVKALGGRKVLMHLDNIHRHLEKLDREEKNRR